MSLPVNALGGTFYVLLKSLVYADFRFLPQVSVFVPTNVYMLNDTETLQLF